MTQVYNKTAYNNKLSSNTQISMNRSVKDLFELYAPDTSSFKVQTQNHIQPNYYKQQSQEQYKLNQEKHKLNQEQYRLNQEFLNNDKDYQKYLKNKKQEIENDKEKLIKKDEEYAKRHREKILKRKIEIENESKYGSQSWVNVRIPIIEKNKFIKQIFPFPGLKDGNFEVWKNQCLTYALIINPKNPTNVRLADGSIVPISLRSNSVKSHNFAVTVTKQSVFGSEKKSAKKKSLFKKKKNFDEVPDHGNVTIDHIINNTVKICVITNINEVIGNEKNNYKLYWIAHSDNAILLYLTGVLNGLVGERIEEEDPDDYFSFVRESISDDIEGQTSYDKLLYLLSHLQVLRNKINKIRGNFQNDDEDTKSDKQNDDDNEELNIDIIDEDLEKLKEILTNNNLLCQSWMDKCNNYSQLIQQIIPTDYNEFIKYIFAEENSDILDYILESYNNEDLIENNNINEIKDDLIDNNINEIKDDLIENNNINEIKNDLINNKNIIEYNLIEIKNDLIEDDETIVDENIDIQNIINEDMSNYKTNSKKDKKSRKVVSSKNKNNKRNK
jgi:hypothetical protein